MDGRMKRLAIAVLLTTIDVATGTYYCRGIWQAFSEDLFARAALVGLLFLWTASAVVLWLHVAFDQRQILREQRCRLALNAVVPPTEPGRDSNV